MGRNYFKDRDQITSKAARHARQKLIPLRLHNAAVLNTSTSDWNAASFQSEAGISLAKFPFTSDLQVHNAKS